MLELRGEFWMPVVTGRSRRRRCWESTGAGWSGLILLPALLSWGCAGPGPTYFPVSPARVESASDGATLRWYDRDRDGHEDCYERLSPDGRLVALGYGAPGGAGPDEVLLADVPDAQRRHLVILLDSIPYAMVRDIWQQGRFRYCPPPSRIISPFPVMTDVSFSSFFGTLPLPGVESSYFDGRRLTSGFSVYASGGNVPWQKYVDYRLNPLAHPFAYTSQHPWFDHELRQIQDLFSSTDQPAVAGYMVSTSALGAALGRDGHQAGLVQLDRFCQSMLFETRGQLRITLFSDHGHYMGSARRIPLPEILTEMGYRVGDALARPGDVVVTEFGMVSCEELHTREPQRVAADLTGVEGVDLAMYREGDAIVVLHRDERAAIARADDGFRYQPTRGDPLRLVPVLERLRAAGAVQANGSVEDAVLRDATFDHVYPDVVRRIWRAFNGTAEHTPDVMLSLHDGYYCGSPSMAALITLIGVHGSLMDWSSSGFAISSAGELPPVLRMDELPAALERIGAGVRTAR